MESRTQSGGFKVFGVIWFGQIVSIFRSGLTGFALGVWVYLNTGSVTKFALINLFTALPGIVLSPVVGALVDRWDRRLVLIYSDVGAALCTLGIVALLWTQRLEIWHIYLLMALSSVCRSFQWPAFTSATTLLVPKRHFGRTAGMTQMGRALAQILAPLLAGVLVVTIELWGVILIDLLSFVFAVFTLLLVKIPQPPRSAGSEEAAGSLWSEILYSWRYLMARPGLMALLLMFASANFTNGMVQVLITPLVLSFAGAPVLGRVLAFASAGALVGGVVMTAWGGPRRRMIGIIVFLVVQGVVLQIGGLQPSAMLIAGAAFVFLAISQIVNGCSQAIWQSKVAPDVQGRVFALRRMVATSSAPLAFLVAGPLADHFFEPLMAADGALAGTVGTIIGVGPGRGIGLMLILFGLLTVLTAAVGSAYRPLRRVQEEIKDFDAKPGPETAAAQNNPGASA